MEQPAPRINPEVVERELKLRGLTPHGFAKKAGIDYPNFWRSLRRGARVSGSILAALAREGIDVREVLLPDAPTPAPDSTAV